MRARRTHRIAVPLLALPLTLATAACRDEVGTAPSSAIEVTASAARVVEGGSVTLGVTSDGRPVDDRDVVWELLAPSTVTVRDGVAHAVAPGVTYVVARVGSAIDSTRLTVGFKGLRANVVGIRVAGAGSGTPLQLGGGAVYSENISSPSSPSFSVLFATSAPAGSSFGAATQADSVLSISFPPGRIVAGTLPIDPMRIDLSPELRITPSSQRQKLSTTLWIREGDWVPGQPLLRRVYVPVTQGTLELTSVQYPATAGRTPGSMAGTISFEAAGITVRYNPDGTVTASPIGTETVMVYAEFTMPLYHELMADGTPITLTTGPNAGTYGSQAEASYVSGGVTLDVHAVLGTTESAPVSETRIWIPGPGVGTFAVGAAPTSAIGTGDGRSPKWWVGDTTGGTTPWARHFAATTDIMNFQRIGEEMNALSNGGTITITEFVAPGAETYGRLVGELSVDLAYWKGGAFTGERTTFRMPLSIPITPLNGPPLY